MRMTVTNGNARNGIRGQRVTLYPRTGPATATILPRADALKHRPALLAMARCVAWAEGVARHTPTNPDAEQMLALFAESKARLVVIHRRAI